MGVLMHRVYVGREWMSKFMGVSVSERSGGRVGQDGR